MQINYFVDDERGVWHVFDDMHKCIVFTHSGDKFQCNLDECVPWGLISVFGAAILDASLRCLSEDDFTEWQAAAVHAYNKASD